jgi:hypothetical protein
MLFGIDPTTALELFSLLLTVIFVVFVVLEVLWSREVMKASEKLAGAITQLQTTTQAIAQNTTGLTEVTRTLSTAALSLSVGTQTLARIESEPKLEYVLKKKDLGLGGIEFELVNKGKGPARAVKITPSSAKKAKLGVSFLGIQRDDIAVGEARSYLLTSVKQADIISLNVEYKDSISGTSTSQTFSVDTS